MSAPRALALLGVTVLAGGCAAREGTVEGLVQASPLACDLRAKVHDEDRPLAGAAVHLRCGESETTLTTTRADGRVHYTGERELPTNCEIVVTKSGYRAQAIWIDDVCVERSRGRCSRLAINADLEPI